MFFVSTPIALVLLLAGRVIAHIEMSSPPPLRSKFNPATPSGSIDYSMTAPLAADGSNFPCKGYQSDFDSTAPVATLQSGSQFNVQLAGTAVHGGGSCQFVLSYDKGKTWAVLASIEGGCPIGLAYSIPVPSIPASDKALFGWTWFNKLGNREMYMNCAVVKTAGSVSSYTGPGLFRANTFADGTCKTIEGQEYVFPNPGPAVQFGGSISSSSPATVLNPCSYDQSTTVTISPGSSNSQAGAAKFHAVVDSSSAAAAPSSQSTSYSASASSDDRVMPVSSPTTSASTTAASVASDSPIRCDSVATWSACSNGSCISMGPVPAGMQCTNGSIVAATSSRKHRMIKKRQVGGGKHGRCSSGRA